MPSKPGPGRPPLLNARDVTKRLRMTADEASAQEAAAAAEGLTWSEWVRAQLAKVTR